VLSGAAMPELVGHPLSAPANACASKVYKGRLVTSEPLNWPAAAPTTDALRRILQSGRGELVHHQCGSRPRRKPTGERRGEESWVPPYLIRSSPPAFQASHAACFLDGEYADCTKACVEWWCRMTLVPPPRCQRLAIAYSGPSG
jgi:hypothetical protein